MEKGAPSRTVPASEVLLWPVLAPPAMAEGIRQRLETIADNLWRQREEMGPDLAGGLPGAALFLGYLAAQTDDATLALRSSALMNLAAQRANQLSGPGLFSGLAGLAWSAGHIHRKLFDLLEEDPGEEVDRIILDLLGCDSWAGSCGLASGLAGFAVYALDRLPGAPAKAILGRVLFHLERCALEHGAGLAWPTPIDLLPRGYRERAPNGYFDLGMVQGIPGILATLALMEEAGHPWDVAALMRPGAAWLVSQTQDPAVGSYLPAWFPVGQDRAEPHGTRTAWGYGDLGASTALLKCAKLLHMPEWERLALALASLAAAGPNPMVANPGLLRGPAGVCQTFMRLHAWTGREIFRGAALASLECLLEGCGDLPAHPPGLAEGQAGAGLVLLAALGGRAPEWDRALLLS